MLGFSEQARRWVKKFIIAAQRSYAKVPSDEADCKHLTSWAVQATERFSLEKVTGMWEALLLQVFRTKNP